MRLNTLLIILLVVSKSFGKDFLFQNKQESNQTDSVAVWLNVAQSKANTSLENKDRLLTKAFNEARNHQPDLLYKISEAALRTGDSSLFRKYNRQVIAVSKKLKEYKSHASAHWDLAIFFRRTIPDSALYHYQEAQNVFTNMELDSTNIHYPGNLLVSIGNLKDQVKDYVGAEKDHIEAIQYFNQIDRKDKLYRAYNSLAIAQNGLNKFNKAIEYHLKAREYIKFGDKGSHFYNILSNENNIASTYLRKGDFNKAFELYERLEKKDSLPFKRPAVYAKILGSKAEAGLKSGLQNFDSIEAALFKSNHILDSINDPYDKARNYEFYAQALATLKKDTVRAIEQARWGKAIAEQTNNNDRLLSTLKLLTTLDKQNSAAYAKDYFDLNETLQQKEREIQDKFARIRMETDEILEENEELARQKAIYGGIAIALLVLGIALFTIISQRISNQRLKFKQKQQESNQEIYDLMLDQHGKIEEGKKSEQKRVSEELHDGVLGQMLGLRLILSGLNERTDEGAMEQRGEMIEKLQEVEEEIRTISHELNASAYEKVYNFIISIQELVKTVANASNINIDFKYEKDHPWDSLPGEVKINTYRMVQECLQNCVKHARCENIVVSFEFAKKTLILNVVDDGVGFDSSKGKKGIGLKNVISRVKKLKGTLKIDSEPKRGTNVQIAFPLHMETDGHLKTNVLRKTTQEV
ncbi:sensor histidine kinase [uncultured Croceitalea sp.]|uniref:tetratricopeptide repeat-containing sensor histidine kinase n=1 Tax=uncultured Croceitalea sp. TaxID=1798908 RepID=UPI0033065A54